MSTSSPKKAALLRDLGQLVIMAAVILTGRSVLADWYVVPTGSMKPTILEGDRVFVWKSAYQLRVPFSKIRLFRTGAPERGDVVVIRNPDGDSVPFVKRLIGLPGDKIEVKNEQLFVNDKLQPLKVLPTRFESGERIVLATETLGNRTHPVRILPDKPSPHRNYGPITVPPDEVFLMGDNRDESRDARFFGTRPTSDLLGKAVGVMWSWHPKFTSGPRWNRIARPFITGAGEISD